MGLTSQTWSLQALQAVVKGSNKHLNLYKQRAGLQLAKYLLAKMFVFHQTVRIHRLVLLYEIKYVVK
jgi:hypothetical protein